MFKKYNLLIIFIHMRDTLYKYLISQQFSHPTRSHDKSQSEEPLIQLMQRSLGNSLGI